MSEAIQDKPAFNIGDTAWVARAHTVEKWVECPCCCGQKAITAIMGDGSHVSIDCSMCAAGYNPPRGVIQDYAFEARAEQITINRVERNNDGTFEYNYCPDVLATEAEAKVRAEQLGIKHAEEERQRLEWRKEHEKRTWAWNAGYHRRGIKEAQRQLEYHTAKLNVAKAKSKEVENLQTTTNQKEINANG